jgi:hypothetical protein
MLAFADRTPGILRYYQELAKAQAEHEKNAEMAESEPAADDLMKIYQRHPGGIGEERKLGLR